MKDWYQEVELNERLEAEQLSRSSSTMSLRENFGAPNSQHSGSRNKKSSKRNKKRRARDK